MSRRKHSESALRRRLRTLAPIVLAAGLLVLTGALALSDGDAQARAQVAPQNTSEPSVAGDAEVGKTLTGNRGTWSGTATITYVNAWLRCDSAGNNCAPVANATATTYALTAADVGSRMRFRVVASNADGSATATSNPTTVVGSTGPPVSTKDPSVTGSAAVDSTLEVDAGTWTGEQPITFTFRWLRCDANGNNCVELSGATDDRYTVRSGDLDRTLRVRVSAQNSEGTRTKLTAPTAKVVAGGVPGLIVLPNGEKSIPVTSVPATARLIVDSVGFDPNPVRSRNSTLSVRIKVKDTRGYVVRDAIVFLRSTPILTSAAPRGKTEQDGTVTYSIQPRADFPIRNGYSVQFFVKAYRAGDNALAGVSGTRLVQVKTAR